MPLITALYAALLGLLLIVISAQAGIMRGRLKIPVGDGGRPELLVAMRRHANFVEYVPMGLVLIGLLEMSGVSGTAIHVLGGALVLFRITHAVGLNASSVNNPARVIGAAGTTLVLLATSGWLLFRFF